MNSQIRRATKSQFDAIVELQIANLAPALDADQKKDGFLSAYFNQDDLKAVDENIGTMAYVNGDRVAGFLCITDVDFNRRFSLPAAMLEHLTTIQFDGKSIDESASCICGPVCIDKDFRGQGIFEKMYAGLRDFVPAKFNLAITLVSTENPRSLAAHRKVGMSPIDEFIWNDKQYVTLAKTI